MGSRILAIFLVWAALIVACGVAGLAQAVISDKIGRGFLGPFETVGGVAAFVTLILGVIAAVPVILRFAVQLWSGRA